MEGDSKLFLNSVYKLLNNHFDLEEIKNLCFELNIDFDSLLGGEGKSSKIRELIQFFARQERLPELLQIVREERPNIEWPNIPRGFRYSPDQAIGDQRSVAPPAPTFNLGDIQASIVNVGGEQTISGPVSVDMRQEPHQAKTNQVEKIKQMIAKGSNEANASLFDLLDDILFELEKLSDETNRKRTLNRLEALVAEMQEEKPDQDMLALTAHSLKRTSSKLKAAQPELVTLVGQLAVAINRR